jgi:hypothetical protein
MITIYLSDLQCFLTQDGKAKLKTDTTMEIVRGHFTFHMRAQRKNRIRNVKINFTSSLKPILITARDQPGIGPNLTTIWISHSQFAVNTKKLAAQLQITPNDLCYNLRSHRFTTESTKRCRNAIKSLGTTRECRLHSYPGLNQMTIESVLDNIPWKKPEPIPGRKRARNLIPQMIQTAPKPDEIVHPEMMEMEITGLDDTNSIVCTPVTSTTFEQEFWEAINLMPIRHFTWDQEEDQNL